MKKKNILILYYTRGVYPLRKTIEDHLYCWKRFSRHNTIYVNVALGYPKSFLADLKIDVIIYHTSFCGMRWSPSTFHAYTKLVADLSERNAVKIAIPQDEFTRTDLLCEFLEAAQVDYVLTCANPSEWGKMYGSIPSEKLRLKTVLTGYLDSETIRKCKRFSKSMARRTIDISYRAWKAEYWLGSHGVHKVKVGEVFKEAADQRGFQTDISFDDKDTKLGDDWIRFLGESRATVGVEGGATVLDRDGTVKARVDRYLEKHPNATFEEVRDACLRELDGRFNLVCISPRHLEAVATGTCQILIEGEYSGILQADRHYIPVREDYSNVDEALEKLRDDTLVEKMTRTAMDEIVTSGRYSYSGFVKEIEREIIEPEPVSPTGRDDGYKRFVLGLRDRLAWVVIRNEVRLANKPNSSREKLIDRIRRAFFALPNW